MLPEDPVRAFQLCYCGWLILSMLTSSSQYQLFYTWFHSSGIGLASKRGLGAHPSKLYGIITPPALTPLQMRAVGVAFTACLLASLAPLAPRPFLFGAFALSLLYFPQLYAEATLSGHNPILVPAVLLLLACAPSLDAAASPPSPPPPPWPLQLLRVYLASGYVSSGVAKVLCSFRFRRYWGLGTSLQHYFLEGMWSRPADSALTRSVQWRLVQSPRLLTIFASGALLFELSFAVAPFSGRLSPLWCAHGLAFHGGILWLQGLDFVSFWSASLLVFAFPLSSLLSADLRHAFEHEPLWLLPAALYTLLQLLTAVSLYDLWLDDILPFSCCPMFMPPRSPFDPLPKWQTMTTAPLTGNVRRSGSMEPLYWSPCSGVFGLSRADLQKLPQRVVWFGSTTGMPPEAERFVRAECRAKPFLLFANFELSAELKCLLHRWVDAINSGELADAWDGAKMEQLLQLQQAGLDAFRACVDRLPQRTAGPPADCGFSPPTAVLKGE